ncbi:MAG TPA: c-type cytochrome [Polyangiaceae bacterium]
MSPPRDSCARLHASTATAVPAGDVRAGATVAIAHLGARTLAYAADEDDAAVHVVDVDARKELGEVALDGRPSQLLFLPDGRLAVLLRDRARVAVLEPGEKAESLEPRCSVDVAVEPVGLARTPDDAKLLVTSGWGRALTVLDARTLLRSAIVSLPREPRSVVVSDDSRFAYVSHAVGARASRVTLADLTVTDIPLKEEDPQTESQERDLQKQMDDLRKKGERPTQEQLDQEAELAKSRKPSCQGFALAKSSGPADRILLPQVLVNTGDPSQRASGYGNDDTATEAGDVAVIDAATGKPMPSSLERSPSDGSWGGSVRPPQGGECLLPRAAAFDPASKSLLVACYGVDQVVAYDGLAASPARAERRRWSVGAGPSGIAVDATKNRALVWSQFDRSLGVIELADRGLTDAEGKPPAPVERIAMARNPQRELAVKIALGRLLFHSVGDGRISRDGRACASCHPDGRDDSLVWATPAGPRRSIALAGRIEGTAPYAWSGAEEDLRVHLATTFDRLNGDGGLKSLELDALMAYVESLTPPPSPSAPADDSQVRRGAQLFVSAEVGCATCHGGPHATDNRKHDVNSKAEADQQAEFNTPSLHLVGGTGPYFHDGRYKSLHDLLQATKDDMGHTSQLSPQDLEALAAYVRTL